MKTRDGQTIRSGQLLYGEDGKRWRIMATDEQGGWAYGAERKGSSSVKLGGEVWSFFKRLAPRWLTVADPTANDVDEAFANMEAAFDVFMAACDVLNARL